MSRTLVSYQLLQQQVKTGFQVAAPSLQRLFVDAALALTDIRVRLDWLSDTTKKTLEISADDRSVLMERWLNEVLCLYQTDRFFARRIVFDYFDGKRIRATLWGETYDANRHGAIPKLMETDHQHIQIGERGGTDPEFIAQVFLKS